MQMYEFDLRVDVTKTGMSVESASNALFEVGCEDAIVGSGIPGYLSLSFEREGASSLQSIAEAIDQVLTALPGSKIIEVTPDLVGLTEIGAVVGRTRQNIRKLFLESRVAYPPSVSGSQTLLWHLADALKWLDSRGRYDIDRAVMETAAAAKQVNLYLGLHELEGEVSQALANVIPAGV